MLIRIDAIENGTIIGSCELANVDSFDVVIGETNRVFIRAISKTPLSIEPLEYSKEYSLRIFVGGKQICSEESKYTLFDNLYCKDKHMVLMLYTDIVLDPEKKVNVEKVKTEKEEKVKTNKK